MNLEELFFPVIEEPDGIRYVVSPVVTTLHAVLSFVFIRMHSLLDYFSKVCIEIENLKSDFASYPRLASKNTMYSDAKKTGLWGKAGTVFERCPQIVEIEAVRNHVIHDGLLDDLPKVYKVVSAGECVDKFVLFPDLSEEGRFDTFKNRTLFYGGEDMINLRLPGIVSEFQAMKIQTLREILNFLQVRSGSPDSPLA